MTRSEPVLVRHRVPPPLRGLVAGVVGFDERAPLGGRWRVQPAGSLLVLAISLTTPLHIATGGAETGGSRAYDAFLAGFMPRPVTTAFHARHTCVQLYFTPLGARRMLGGSAPSAADRVVSLDELSPRLARDLPDQLAGLATWPERFAVLDRYLLRLAAAASPADPLTQWVWAELRRSGGSTRISELAGRSGWSPRHVRSRFTEVVGVSPKTAAQVLRFERVHAALKSSRLDQLAARHGFADQSHLTREVRRFSGDSPVELARARRPTAATALGGRILD